MNENENRFGLTLRHRTILLTLPRGWAAVWVGYGLVINFMDGDNESAEYMVIHVIS